MTSVPTSKRRWNPIAQETQLADLRAQLEEQRGFRVDQLRSLCLARAARSGAGANRTSREITISLMRAARSALGDVTAALRRMDDGEYGRCTSCGGAIPLDRLEVLPQVAMCMPCQHMSERSEQQA